MTAGRGSAGRPGQATVEDDPATSHEEDVGPEVDTSAASTSDDGQLRIDVIDVADLVDGGALLLDVRDLDEWQALRAPDALLIPVSLLDPHALPPGRTIVVLSSTGGRADVAARELAATGRTAIVINGGLLAWVEAGLPVDGRLQTGPTNGDAA